MDAQEFRKFGLAAINYVVDYLENIRERPVLSSVEPGYLFDKLPNEIPENSESWTEVMKDLDEFIMPGLTHWQSPNFHAYYPSETSYAAIVSEIFIAAFAVNGFNWITSPACTELEVIVTDWLAKFFNLPEQFLSSSKLGGGMLNSTSSESILLCFLAARERKTFQVISDGGVEEEIRGRLVGYTSIHSNSQIEKSGNLSNIKLQFLAPDENSCFRGTTLEMAIMDDLAKGLIPTICVSSFGTTGTCSFDNIQEIGPICAKYGLWMHVDAAYAGAALCLPEYEHLRNGLEFAHSLNFNLYKWMLMNASVLWLKDSKSATRSFNIQRIYLDDKHQNPTKVPEYRHWQLPLTRHFRSLKVWITLRCYGQEKIRDHLRNHIKLAEFFMSLVLTDDRFEFKGISLGLVFFRLRGDCMLNRKVIDIITNRRKIFVIPALFADQVVIRFVICGFDAQQKDMELAWREIQDASDEVLNRNTIEAPVLKKNPSTEMLGMKDLENLLV